MNKKLAFEKEMIDRIILKSALQKELLKEIPKIIKLVQKINPEKFIIFLDNYANKSQLSNEHYAELIEMLANSYIIRSNPKIKEQLRILIRRPELHTFLKGLFL